MRMMSVVSLEAGFLVLCVYQALNHTANNQREADSRYGERKRGVREKRNLNHHLTSIRLAAKTKPKKP